MSPALVLRAVVGFVLVATAILKAISLGDPAFRDTLVWSVSRGRIELIVVLVVLETFLGAAFALGWRPVATASVITALLAFFLAVLLFFDAEAKGCGCLGSVVRHAVPRPRLIAQNVILIVATWLGVRWSDLHRDSAGTGGTKSAA